MLENFDDGQKLEDPDDLKKMASAFNQNNQKELEKNRELKTKQRIEELYYMKIKANIT